MPKGLAWETSASQALLALGGEASEIEVLKWVQENRPRLRPGWQARVRNALWENADGRGKARFESVPGKKQRWRLADGLLSRQEPILSDTPERAQMKRIGKLMAGALSNPTGGEYTALECYLLGVVAYKVGWFGEAEKLLAAALDNGLGEDRRSEAEMLCSICTLKRGR